MTSVDKHDNNKNIESIYPLSPIQQGMLFHTVSAPESGVYFNQCIFTLHGHLNVSAFERAWQEVVKHYPVLRTTFVWENLNKLLQIVCKSVNLPWDNYDWRSLPPIEQQGHLEAFLQADRNQSFKLNQAPLMRCALICVADDTYHFVWSFHHILLDGWSLPLIVKQVLECYQAFCNGKKFQYQASTPYRNYITWLQKQDLAQAERFWRQKFQGFIAPTPLIVDRPLTNSTLGHHSEQQIQLRVEATTVLQSLAKQHQLTLSNLVQGAWALLLSRYSGESEVVFGVTISGRPPSLVGVELMVGPLINTLPLRVSVSGEVKLLPWLKDLQIQLVECEQYSYSPLMEIQNWSDIPRGMPLFESIVVFENYPIDESLQQQISSLEISDIRFIEQTNYPLTLVVVPGSQLSINIGYNTSRFDADTIDRMLGHLQTLLEGMVANPQQRLIDLPMLTASEQHQLLVEWNDTLTPYPQDQCIHHLFEAQVKQTPDAIAIIFEEQQLTYLELNCRANLLAHYLLTLNVGADVPIGLCVERSLEMIVGLLGILKAGGAYVPLDPNYPQERLSYMLTDSQLPILITQRRILGKLPEHQAQTICLDTDWQIFVHQSPNNPVSVVTSQNLSYIIYTSGSTGSPKGTMITHSGMVNYLSWCTKNYHVADGEGSVVNSSMSFDATITSLFSPLLVGRKVLLLSEQEEMTSLKVALSSGNKFSLVKITPAHLEILSHLLADEKVEFQTQALIIGGEALTERVISFWQRYAPRTRLINEYGPTETVVGCCIYEVNENTFSGSSIPIGRPIANTKLYILDKYLQPIPIGVVGELYIGGAGVAKGYLNRPQLTDERFIINPFHDLEKLNLTSVQQSKLYKTGDLARYLADGNIEYVGRIDNQVKVRGFRIELGEIEFVLNTYPQIQQAVVIVREDIPGNKRLVAYLVSTSESLTSNQLREFLLSKLPEYMVPAVFVMLETIPLTPNGKINRLALPTPEGEITRQQEYIAPTTAREQILTHIWQEVLLKEQVSIHDNFFEIGGDSIVSIQVVSRAKNAGIQITPKQIFQNQTIAELARVANTTTSVITPQGLVRGVAPLTPIQHWFWAKNPEEAHHYNQSVFLEIPHHSESELIATAWEKLREHHDALRLRFTSSEQINPVKDENIVFAVVDLSSTPSDSLAETLSKIATEYQASLNLSTGPIIKVVMFNLGSHRDARLLIIIHHLAVDGVSWRILLSDFKTIYQQLKAQKPPKLSAKTTAFIDWAKKLKDYAQTEMLLSELDYWLNQPWSQTIRLPLNYPQIQLENTVASAATVSVKLSPEETRVLLRSVNEAYKTQINDILLSALVQVLAEWTGNSKILIDLEGHGREEILTEVDLSRTVGWFTSLFPVLLQLPSINQPAEIIKSIKEQLRAIPNHGIGYGILRYLCEPTVNQQLQTIPPAEISFNYLGQFDSIESETGWKLATELTGSDQSLKQKREHLWEINALVVKGELQIDWTYSSHVHSSTTVENLAQSYLQAIRSLIEHCQTEDAFGYTPSDFPDAQLNQSELDKLLTAVKRKNIESIYPLSPMQQGMLFHSLYAPGSGIYFEQMVISLQGKINVTAFKEAWQKVVDRHSVLRTLFVWSNRPTPLQVVLKQVDLFWKHLDWLTLSSTQQQQQLSELLSTQRRQGFEFDQAPLMSCTLIQLSDDTYKFIFSHHHILMDGWCLSIIFTEVLSFYEAELRGQTSYLPTPPPYRNYIAWLNSQNNEAAGEFWRQTLQGFSAPTPLVVDQTPAPHHQPFSDYKQLELRLSAEVSRDLQSLVQKHHLTLSTIVQAAWGLLLSRYSGEDDIVFGVTVSGRPASLSGVENLVGLFINTLPLRLHISPQEQLIPWLKRIQELMVELQHYSYTPLVDIQALSEISGGMSLFESIVVFENYPIHNSLPHEDTSLHVTDVESFEQTNYPLTLIAVPGDELRVRISYDTVRFEQDAIARMLGHLETLISAIVANPVFCVGELPLLSAAERHQLLIEWNDTASVYPTDKCLHQLFEEQVEKTPDNIAVIFEDLQLTYLELNQRANQLAHYLQALGVKPEVLVGICVERSVEMVVGLLAILKAGGAYVPLDPNYPTERLNYMLEDSGVEVLLTQRLLTERLPQHKAQLIRLDTDWQLISQSPQDNPITDIQATNLAYVIYTSGSTGQPKGVEMNQLPLCNLIWWHLHNMKISHGAKTLQFAPVSFDVCFQEIFSTWCSGGILLLITEEVRRDPLALLRLLEEKAVERLFLPFVKLQQLAEVTARNKLVTNNLKEIITAGEQLQITPAISKWLNKLTGCNLHNHYGPSESHVVITFTLTKLVESWPTLPPIGRPISNTQIYILDQDIKPVPIGVSGELYIGGNSLARGYFNRPELTQEKFIPNPFSDNKSERLYKTGDLARYLADGNIEYVGRIDNQVKVRGFRIELGEIESVLNTYPQIQQAVVIVREDIPGNKCLVAYLVSTSESLTSNQLREFLLSKLPEYMVPAAFVMLETLPLTPNGKINRLALPAPYGEITRQQEYVAPTTPSAEIIANIFTQILNVENVSLHDNFFTLGGHSLLATQLISRLRQAFSVEIPLRKVFESPTVASLDKILTQLRTTESGLSLPSIPPRETHSEQLPLSWAQERLWFLNQLEGSSATYNIPTAVRITGNLDINALQQAFSEIVRRHEVLRTSFPTVNGTAVQLIHPQTTINIPVVDLQQLANTQSETVIQQLAQLEATTPFNLEIAPLIRCRLLQLSAREYVVLLTMHHIVSDGWSIGVFIQELSSLYQAFGTGESSPLPELPIQYADFAVWQRQWLSGEVLETQLNYWLSQLHGAPELLQLPTTRPRLSVQTYRGHTQSFRINTDLSQKLHILSGESGTTLFMTLYAAFVTLLYRYSGQSDILVGTPIANRNRSEIESLIGFFVNTVVLRTQVENNPSFQNLLTQVRETTLQAYEHQDVPFEQVVEALQPQRSLAYSPLFQVMFVLQNEPMGEIKLPGLTLSEEYGESTIAKFDLTLSMTQTQQGLVGSWEYNTDLFDGSTIERMAGHFQNLLLAIVENPLLCVGELPLLSAAERHQLLIEWNDTASVYPTDNCIHQLFEEQVEKTPDNIAVVFEDLQLTYLELNQRANQLAHHLQALGVKPEVLVGICVERSVEMVVGLLAILKAGGAYVPLDPNYPTERLSYMLEDSGVEVLLTLKQVVAGLPKHKMVVVFLDIDWHQIAQQSKENPITEVISNNLAYTIYTSGSTGKPKAVQILHSAVVNFLCTMRQQLGMRADDILLGVTTFTFDIAALEIFLPIIVGACLVVATREVTVDGKQLLNLLIKSEITIIQATPATWRLLLEAGWQNSHQLTILCGGETLPQELANQLQARSTSLWNVYGPTETTIWSLISQVESQSGLISIGHPIANTKVYILDCHLQPVPIGVPGELHIGGDGLARGYLNLPELTQEKFILNPFSDAKLERLYKTGDLARYLPDGNIDYLGRIDNQVKMRGFRIELGEIESVLSTHPQIQQAIVIVREDIPGDKRLVAYLVLNEQLTPGIHEWQQFLMQKLPDYMIPSAFVYLDSLPLTPNGKVDRQNSHLLDATNLTAKTHFAPPLDHVEHQLSEIWAAVLNTYPIGVQDNFFDLGGHSLLAVQLMAQIQQQFDKNISLAALFQYPTVGQIATIIREPINSSTWSPLVIINSTGSKKPFFCVPGAGGNPIYLYKLAHYLGREQPFYALQALGLDGESQIHTKVEDIAAYYIQAIQSLQPEGPYLLGGHSFGGLVAFEMAQQLQKRGYEVPLLAILDSGAPSMEVKYVNNFSHFDNADWLNTIASLFEEIYEKNLEISGDFLKTIPSDQQLDYFRERLEAANLLPPNSSIKQLRGLLEVYKANIQTVYRVQEIYPNEITCFFSSETDVQSSEILDDLKNSRLDWQKFSSRKLNIHFVPGNHLTMLSEPHVKVLAEYLITCIECI